MGPERGVVGRVPRVLSVLSKLAPIATTADLEQVCLGFDLVLSLFGLSFIFHGSTGHEHAAVERLGCRFFPRLLGHNLNSSLSFSDSDTLCRLGVDIIPPVEVFDLVGGRSKLDKKQVVDWSVFRFYGLKTRQMPWNCVLLWYRPS